MRDFTPEFAPIYQSFIEFDDTEMIDTRVVLESQAATAAEIAAQVVAALEPHSPNPAEIAAQVAAELRPLLAAGQAAPVPSPRWSDTDAAFARHELRRPPFRALSEKTDEERATLGRLRQRREAAERERSKP